MKLEGKIAIITGGAMGNGLGIARAFLKYKAKVIILDYSEEINETVIHLKELGEVEGYEIDIRDREKVEGCIKGIVDSYGKIDILVNNAGVAKLAPFLETDDELRDYHFDINIKGTWNVTKAVLPHMKEGGSIINLSSVTGPMVADPGEVAYATTKAANLGFTKALAAEVVKDKIRVNAILPGYIMTPLVEKLAETVEPKKPQNVIDGIIKGIPMGRMGTIEEVGELVAFLASNESSYITGQGIVIDGASTLPETMVVDV